MQIHPHNTFMDKKLLIRLLQESTAVRLCVALSSPSDEEENIAEGQLNDFVLRQDGTLELWVNTGYEI